MRIFGLFAFVCLLGSMAGCGGSNAPSPPSGGSCNVVFSGTLHDSLTDLPVTRQAAAMLESGKQQGASPLFEFLAVATAKTDANGSFRLCAPSVSTPSVLVLSALDSSGNAYPALLLPVSASTNFGTLPMGICRGICSFGQQQTSAPAIIEGAITSDPIAKAGTVAPQYSLGALDNSSNLWAIAAPLLDTSESYAFNTSAGTCPGGAPFCTTYTFTLPSQNPIVPAPGGYSQQVGSPGYMIYAVPEGDRSCTPPFALVVSQQNGTPGLPGDPGAQLTAATIDFASCR